MKFTRVFNLLFLFVFYSLIFLQYSGGLGQLGIECAKLLRSRYGSESVILSDIVKPSDDIMENGPYIFCDILDFKVNATVMKSTT